MSFFLLIWPPSWINSISMPNPRILFFPPKIRSDSKILNEDLPDPNVLNLCVNNLDFFSKVWWHAAPLFLFTFTLIEQTYNIYLYHSCYPHCFRTVVGLLWRAEPRFDLGPALQQADALLIHAAPWATTHFFRLFNCSVPYVHFLSVLYNCVLESIP